MEEGFKTLTLAEIDFTPSPYGPDDDLPPAEVAADLFKNMMVQSLTDMLTGP